MQTEQVLTRKEVRERYLRKDKTIADVRFDHARAVYDVRESEEEIFARPPTRWGERLYAGELAEFGEGLRTEWIDTVRSRTHIHWYFDARRPENHRLFREALESVRAESEKYVRPIIAIANFGATIIE